MELEIQPGALVAVFNVPQNGGEKDEIGIVQKGTPEPGCWIVSLPGKRRMTRHSHELMAICCVSKKDLEMDPDIAFKKYVRNNRKSIVLALTKRARQAGKRIIDCTI